MSIEIKVPTLGESVTEATVAEWMKAEGDAVEVDETLLVLETEKVSLEVYAPAAGVIGKINAKVGAEVEVGAILGTIEESGGAGKGPAKKGAKSAPVDEETKAAPIVRAQTAETATPPPVSPAPLSGAQLAPSVRKMVEEHKVDARDVTGTGKSGRITKGDVLTYLEHQGMGAPSPLTKGTPTSHGAPAPSAPSLSPASDGPREERVKMTRLRQKIAERLKQAQNTAAMLTTFNEVDMTALMEARNLYKDKFAKKHGVKLGFMSFFAKACVIALKEIPEVNAEIDGDEVVYKNYCNIGVAVGGPQGLVVPVIKDADAMSFAGIEGAIAGFGTKAKNGELTMADMSGGTFTISNGGVYGSLMSTPILNPPQSGILGMHKIQNRPVVVGAEIVIRPMMYLALSYDHRVIDGREAVSFLVRVKECIEDPNRILLDM